MKKRPTFLLIIASSLLFFRCVSHNQFHTPEEEKISEAELNKKIEKDLINERTRIEALEFRDTVTDSVFLKTKRPMSDDAIGAIWPYSYETGLYEDRAYNRVVYIIAFERVQKCLDVENNQFVNTLHSGAEVNIAEDLYEYILNVFNDWNLWVREGRFKIVKNEEGYYGIR